MITIIKEPASKERKEFTCLKCGCIFQADEWDYEYWSPNGHFGYRIACPICKDKPWRFYNPIINEYEGVKDIKAPIA